MHVCLKFEAFSTILHNYDSNYNYQLATKREPSVEIYGP